MLLNLLINAVLWIFGALMVFLPVVSLPTLLSDSLTYAVQIYNTFMETVPYAQIVWNIFIGIILPFELLLLVAKFFLGHRLPAHLN